MNSIRSIAQKYYRAGIFFRETFGWLWVVLPIAIMAFYTRVRMEFIDSIFGVAVTCDGCFNRDIWLNDLPLIALIAFLALLGFKLKNWILSRLFRVGYILIILVYIMDIVTSTELSSRLLLGDALAFLGDLKVINNHLNNMGFINMGLLALVVLGLLLSLLWPALTSLQGRLGIFLPVLCVVVFITTLMLPKTQYVHNWAIDNVAKVNWQRGERIHYSKKKIKEVLAQPAPASECSPGKNERYDIIVLVLESWSAYQSKFFGGLYNWTPQLDELAQQGLSFKRFHAAGFGTNEGLMGLFSSMELLSTGKLRTPFITAWGSQYYFPVVLGRNGYHTSFLTGGNLNFSRKGKWLEHTGFNHIEGHNHPAYDGLPRFHFAAPADEALYQRALVHLDELEQKAQRQPYAVVVENVSSHHPYKHPHTHSKERADVFGYMDETAADFIRKLQARGFFEHGRLLVVSDHRAMVPVEKQEQEKLGLAVLSRVPAFWLGKGITSGQVHELFHQADLLPTIERSVAEQYCSAIGIRDMLAAEESTPRCFFHARGDMHELVNVFCPEGQGVIKLAGDKTRFQQAQGLSNKQQEQLVDWLNRYRIQRDHLHEQWLQISAP